MQARITHDNGSQLEPISPGSSCHVGVLSAASRWPYFYHSHNCFELLIIEEGHCHYKIGNFAAGCGGPTIFLFAPSVPHTFYTDGFLPDGRKIRSRTIWFSADIIEGMRTRMPEYQAIRPIIARSRYGLQFNQQVCAQIVDILHEVPRSDGLFGIALVMRILALLSESHSWQLSKVLPDSDVDSRDLERISHIDNFLRTHYRSPILLSECAHACGMSESTLNILLKKHFRQTFLEYLNSIRINAAKEGLEKSNHSITDIALDCGFSSIPTFNRRFKQMTGDSPSTFRKRFDYH